MSNAEELKQCLALQTEIDQKLDQLFTMTKKILRAAEGRVITEIDGELYELTRASHTTQAVESCRKHGGFFCEYRLIRLPKPIK